MNYYIQIFGCQMNKSDAERIASLLDSIGYTQVDNKESADLIVVVTCSVRQTAEDRVYGLIRHIKKLKKTKSNLKVIITGCMALRSEVVKKIKDVDIFLDIKDLKKLPELLNKKGEQFNYDNYFAIKPKYQSNFTAYVPIMTGCNNYCSYCIVPYVRGREESRDPEEIIKEVKDLIKSGYKEIILLGQNVNSYSPSKNKLGVNDFPDLLEIISQLDGKFWLRFLTCHPKDLSEKLIKVMAKYEKITEYINLALQSGDDYILHQMNRNYTVDHYKNLIKKLRKYMPEISVSTDVIVGFPGETQSMFNNTCKIFKQVKFDMAYINQYSTREGTAAAKLKEDVPKAEKKRRDKKLTEILSETALDNNKKLLGKTLEVLVDNKKNDLYMGKTRTFKVIKFKSKENILGQFAKIKVVSADSFGLKGNIVD